MNLINVKDRIVKATANTAIVFEGLDQMAANDEYVNSEGLNVKRKKEAPAHHDCSNVSTSRTTSTISSHNTYHDLSHQPLHSGHKTFFRAHGTQATTSHQQQHPHNSTFGASFKTKHTTIIHSYDKNQEEENDDNDSSKDDSVVKNSDTQDKDFILFNAMTPNETRQELTPVRSFSTKRREENFSARQQSSLPCTSTQSQTHTKKAKDPNRFMTDLDARISKPFIPEEPLLCIDSLESQRNVDLNFQTNKTNVAMKETITTGAVHHPSIRLLKQPFGFLNSMVSSSTTATDRGTHDEINCGWIGYNMHNSLSRFIPGLIPGPMGRDSCNKPSSSGHVTTSGKRPQDGSIPNNNNNADDGVVLIQSDALLGEFENDELSRIRQRMNMDFMTMSLDMLDKHRQYVGILFIFLAMVLGYIVLIRNRVDDGHY